MNLQLNPVFETFFLLIQAQCGKRLKKEAIKQLDEFGVNGAAFYAANFPVFERYTDAFANKLVQTDGTAAFKDMCDQVAFIVVYILVLKPEWLDDFDAVSEEEVATAVHDMIAAAMDEAGEIIEALEASGMSDQEKWQIAALLQQPKKKLAHVIEAINANREAFDHAYASIATDVEPLLVQLGDQQEKGELPPTIQSVATLAPGTPIVPTMAAPLMVLASGEQCFVGLLLDKIFSGQNETLTETEAVLIAKSLSDPSKLKILSDLTGGKLYSQEIAEKLGLTPATTSHHMNMLLSAGLVEISKEGTKAYYRLCHDRIERYRDWLEKSFMREG